MDREIMKKLDLITERINRLEIVFREVMDNQQNKQNILDQKISTLITKLEQTDLLNTSITSVVSNLACVQENMEEVVRKVDRMETSLNETLKHGQDEVKKSLEDFRTEATTEMEHVNEDLKNSLKNLETTMVAEVSAVKDVVFETKSLVKTFCSSGTLNDIFESVTQKITILHDESIKQVQDSIDRTQFELSAITENITDLLRDRIVGPFPTYGKYSECRKNSEQQLYPLPELFAVSPGHDPLTTCMLAPVPDEERKQRLGEKLFPLIQQMNFDMAGKITGMFLELEDTELLYMLESKEALELKVQEAEEVLQAHQAKEHAATKIHQR